MFDWKKPSVQMLGRWQPWHKGHTELFKKAHKTTGQVAIMCRTLPLDDNNPFDFHQVKYNILESLKQEGFKYKSDFIIIQTPNIVNISYGREVGYSFTQHDLGEDIHSISATKIREKLREKK